MPDSAPPPIPLISKNPLSLSHFYTYFRIVYKASSRIKDPYE